MKKRKELILDRGFQKWIIMAMILPFIDVVTTILFTSKYGIESEANFIGVFLMNNFGNVGYLFMYLFAFFVLSLTFHIVKYFPVKIYKIMKVKIKNKKKFEEFNLKLFMGLLIATYSITYAINLTTFLT